MKKSLLQYVTFEEIKKMTNGIAEQIGLPAAVENIAEEATELAKAALKYARFLRGENPVRDPNYFKLYEHMIEEFNDVLLAISAIGLRPDRDIISFKVQRFWTYVNEQHDKDQEIEDYAAWDVGNLENILKDWDCREDNINERK